MRAPETTEWLDQWAEEPRAQAAELADLVESTVDGATAAVKWKRLTYTVDDDYHHWLCAVAVSRRGVDLVFHKGSLLPDPESLLQGEGRYLRQLPHADVMAHRDATRTLLREALARRTDL